MYVDISKDINIFDINVESSSHDIEQVVVTGTKTFKRQNESPVIVNVIDSRKLQSVQAVICQKVLIFNQELELKQIVKHVITLN